MISWLYCVSTHRLTAVILHSCTVLFTFTAQYRAAHVQTQHGIFCWHRKQEVKPQEFHSNLPRATQQHSSRSQLTHIFTLTIIYSGLILTSHLFIYTSALLVWTSVLLITSIRWICVVVVHVVSVCDVLLAVKAVLSVDFSGSGFRLTDWRHTSRKAKGTTAGRSPL